MYFDATGKYVHKNDIHKSQNLSSYDIVNNTNRICKGKCIQFKARKPLTCGRYEAGQYRCQTCEIYLTVQGIDGNFCRCCNFRVRSKPRNSLYKEKFNEKVRNAKDPWISTDEVGNIKEDTKENEIEDHDDGKKHTPIYEEIDELVKTYYEFKEFLESKIKPQSNYQYVMLKELLEYGELHKGEIAESLAYFNNKNTFDEDVLKYYFDVPVYGVLLNHEFITESNGPLPLPYYTLNVKLEDFQRIELIDYLLNTIVQYNEEHNIPENEFPNANNMGNIEWTRSNIIKKSKIQKFKNFVKKIHPIESQNNEHVKIFDFEGDTLSIKNCTIERTDIIQKDQILTNDDVISTFKVANIGEIRYTKENDVIVLLSTYSNDYDDSIDIDSRLIIYTGEGKGDQELKNGNEKILNSQNTPMVLFKEVYQEKGARPRGALDNKYKFIGVVKYQKYYWKEEKGRQVVKFVLEIQS